MFDRSEKMILIAICDDDPQACSYVHKRLELYVSNLVNESLDIKVFNSGKILLDEIEGGTFFHIIFMDIEMKDMNGVDTVSQIRETTNGDDSLIVFISAHETYFKEIAYVGSFRFIHKPFADTEVDIVIQRLFRQVLKYKAVAGVPNVFVYRVNQGDYAVKIDQLVYLKSKERRVEIYIWDFENKDIKRSDIFYGKLEDQIEKLPSSLYVRCERSYIVNLSFVERMTDINFLLCDKKKTQIPISKRYRENVMKIYFRQLESQI